MAIAAITRQGLITLAVLVAALWGCLINERLTMQKAEAEMGRTLREMRQQRAKARHDIPAGTRRGHGAVG